MSNFYPSTTRFVPPRLATNMATNVSKHGQGLPTPSPSTATTSKYKSWKASATKPAQYQYFHIVDEEETPPPSSSEKKEPEPGQAANNGVASSSRFLESLDSNETTTLRSGSNEAIHRRASSALATPCPSPIVSEFYDAPTFDWEKEGRRQEREGRMKSARRETRKVARLPSMPRLPALKLDFLSKDGEEDVVDELMIENSEIKESTRKNSEDHRIRKEKHTNLVTDTSDTRDKPITVPVPPSKALMKSSKPRVRSNRPPRISSIRRKPAPSIYTRQNQQLITSSILERLSPTSPIPPVPPLPNVTPSAYSRTERKAVPEFPFTSLSHSVPSEPLPSGGSTRAEFPFPVPGATPGPRPDIITSKNLENNVASSPGPVHGHEDNVNVNTDSPPRLTLTPRRRAAIESSRASSAGSGRGVDVSPIPSPVQALDPSLDPEHDHERGVGHTQAPPPTSRFSEDYDLDFESATSMTVVSGRYTHAMPFPLPPADVPPLPLSFRSKGNNEQIRPLPIPPRPPSPTAVLHRTYRTRERERERQTDASATSTAAATYNSGVDVGGDASSSLRKGKAKARAQSPVPVNRVPANLVERPSAPVPAPETSVRRQESDGNVSTKSAPRGPRPRALAPTALPPTTTLPPPPRPSREQEQAQTSTRTPAHIATSNPPTPSSHRMLPTPGSVGIGPTPNTGGFKLQTTQRALLTPATLGPTTPSSQRVLLTKASREFPNFGANARAAVGLGRDHERVRERTNGYAFVHRPVVYSSFKLGERDSAADDAGDANDTTKGKGKKKAVGASTDIVQETVERILRGTTAAGTNTPGSSESKVVGLDTSANVTAGRPVLGSSKQKSSHSAFSGLKVQTPASDRAQTPGASSSKTGKTTTLPPSILIPSKNASTKPDEDSMHRERERERTRLRLNLNFNRSKPPELPKLTQNPIPIPSKYPARKPQVSFDANHVIDISPTSPAAHGIPELLSFQPTAQTGQNSESKRDYGKGGAAEPQYTIPRPTPLFFDRPTIHKFPSYRLPEISRTAMSGTRRMNIQQENRIVSTGSSALDCGCQPGGPMTLKNLTMRFKRLGLGSKQTPMPIPVKAGAGVRRLSASLYAGRKIRTSMHMTAGERLKAAFGFGKSQQKTWWERKEREREREKGKREKKRKSTDSDRYYRGL